MNPDDTSFRLNRRARSFRVTDFALRDLPLLVLVFGLLTLLSLVFAWLPSILLPERWRWIFGGFMLGLSCGIWGCSWFQGRAAKTHYDLSAEMQELARDPAQLIETIKLFRQEHPDVSLAAAKRRIEEFYMTGK